ncbi:MAG TPA: hypothetical protein PLP33_27730 [Leptospiraceae bacterium]|nr:hypothetical protein [Leptospiraceae bacterium]
MTEEVIVPIEERPLDDGYGNKHSRTCPECNQQTMYIHLPGDFRCRICYKESWVSVPLEYVLESISGRTEPRKTLVDLYEEIKSKQN